MSVPKESDLKRKYRRNFASKERELSERNRNLASQLSQPAFSLSLGYMAPFVKQATKSFLVKPQFFSN